MDPTQIQYAVSNPAILPLGSYMFTPGIFDSDMDRDDFLSSLDSDTRDYVMKHTNDFRTRKDIIDCVNKLRGY
jgi:hypothetical protein